MKKFFIAGNVVRNLEIKESKSGVLYSIITVAVNDYDSKNKQIITDFFDISIFGKIIESLVKNVGKGSTVVIEGTISKSKSTTNNETKYFTNFIANNVKVLNRKPPIENKVENNENEISTATSELAEFEYPVDIDDIPL